ncbi:MAG: hypothetical protein IJY50_06050 [Clostridia bacterium]|nr:hypothetical protein [Clostridia bacterium]
MRKFLAAILAVMMLVGVVAVLPASAEDVAKSAFDNSTADQRPTLIITEMLQNSKTGHTDFDDKISGTDAAVWTSPDAFDYIEIYNAGETEVNLYDYAIAGTKSSGFRKTGANPGKFTNMIKLTGGDIYTAEAPANAKEYQCYNPSSALLKPGQFAVIWFWTGDTDKIAGKVGPTIAPTATDIPFTYFRNYYNVPDEALVLAVCGKGGNTAGGIASTHMSLNADWMYAIVPNDWNLDNNAVTTPGQNQAQLDPRVECMAEWCVNTPVGILTNESMDNFAAYYVPANAKPELLNENRKVAGETEFYDDYVAAGYVKSYMETAVVAYTEAPSPGTMPAWQWNYVDPVGASKVEGAITVAHGLASLEARIYAEAVAANAADANVAVMDYYNAKMAGLVYDWVDRNDKKFNEGVFDTKANPVIKGTDGKLLQGGESTWQTAGVSAWLSVTVQKPDEVEDNQENQKDYSEGFVDRAELEERNKDRKPVKNNTKKGLPVWALILIIVGGVLVVGAIVVVVIIVIKKKNKPVAADDVSAEGEVEVIDETAEEAPAEAAAEEEDKQ